MSAPFGSVGVSQCLSVVSVLVISAREKSLQYSHRSRLGLVVASFQRSSGGAGIRSDAELFTESVGNCRRQSCERTSNIFLDVVHGVTIKCSKWQEAVVVHNVGPDALVDDTSARSKAGSRKRRCVPR